MKIGFFGKNNKDNTTNNIPNNNSANNTTTNNKSSNSSIEDGSGRAYSGLAKLRQSNLLQQAVIIALIAHAFWSDYNWRAFADELSQKQWVVFHDRCGDTEAMDAVRFQTGASDVQIKKMAWDMFVWIRGAGTNTVDSYYKQALKFMTQKMQDDLFRDLEKRRVELQTLNIYFSIENTLVRQIRTDELPLDAQKAGFKATRYDVLVKATVTAFREGTKEVLGNKDYTYWMHLIPLSNPTMENATGLLVDSMIPIESRLPNKKAEETLSQNTTKEEGK